MAFHHSGADHVIQAHQHPEMLRRQLQQVPLQVLAEGLMMVVLAVSRLVTRLYGLDANTAWCSFCFGFKAFTSSDLDEKGKPAAETQE